jgi:chromosomal replication initiator protein
LESEFEFLSLSDLSQSSPTQKRVKTALLELLSHISLEEKAIWFGVLRVRSVSESHFILLTDGLFKKKRIEEVYLPKLLELLQIENGKIHLEVKVESLAASEPDEKNSPLKNSKTVIPSLETSKSALPFFEPDVVSLSPLESEPSRNKINLGLNQAGLDTRLSFERYVLHDENRLALQCAKKVTQKLGECNPLYLFGPSGSGKTHLIQAIGKYYQDHFPYLKIRYLSPLEFLSDYRHALTTKTDRAFRLRYRALDVLLIDDIQFFSGKTETCVEFFHLFNEIYVPGKQMVFTSDMPPSALDRIDERLKSRLASGIIAEMEGPKENSRRHLLDFYLEEAHVDYAEEVRAFLVKSLPADARRVMSAVKTLVAAESIYAETVDVAFVRKVLGGILAENTFSHFSPEGLIQAVVSYSKISLDDLRSSKRTQSISFYRQLAMYLLRKHAKLTLTQIAEHLGGKSAASVTQAIHSVEERLKADPMLVELATKLATVQG